MAGVTSIEVKESLDELTQQLCQVKTSSAKERLQVLYWLKQDNAPSINAIARAMENIETRYKPGYRCTEKGEWKRCWKLRNRLGECE